MIDQFTNTILLLLILSIVGIEAYGIYYTLQFRSRLAFLVPWALAVILTVAALKFIDIVRLAHNAEYEILTWIQTLASG